MNSIRVNFLYPKGYNMEIACAGDKGLAPIPLSLMIISLALLRCQYQKIRQAALLSCSILPVTLTGQNDKGYDAQGEIKGALFNQCGAPDLQLP